MSDQLCIVGGRPLKGRIQAVGAKNAITKMLVASLISDKACTFTNVPNITEVEATVALCQEIGMEVNWDREKRTMRVITRKLKTTYIPQRFSGANRIPILMIGALLSRTSEDIVVPTVGGCRIGARPVGFHIQALQQLGAKIEYRAMKTDGAYFAQSHKGLKGSIIELPYPSVGATENTIIAATRAKGTTVIKNAAIECEIIDLILFLQKMGVHIYVDVNRTIVIQSTKTFYEVEHSVMPDRIMVATLAMAAIATEGSVFIEGAKQEHLITFLNTLREVNGGFCVQDGGIQFYHQGPLKGGVHIETDVHPGFMTDWQPPMSVLLTQARGASVVHETVYENRFGYVEILRAMGADMELFNPCLGSRNCRFANKNHKHSAVIKGPTPLEGTHIAIPDLRAGFAYVMAALIAEGRSTITNLHFLDRGYEKIDGVLGSLGADVTRTPIESPAEKTWATV